MGYVGARRGQHEEPRVEVAVTSCNVATTGPRVTACHRQCISRSRVAFKQTGPGGLRPDLPGLSRGGSGLPLPNPGRGPDDAVRAHRYQYLFTWPSLPPTQVIPLVCAPRVGGGAGRKSSRAAEHGDKQEQCFKRMRLAAQKLERHSIGHTMIWGNIVVGFFAILCDA